jgi:hypothetical protein
VAAQRQQQRCQHADGTEPLAERRVERLGLLNGDRFEQRGGMRRWRLSGSTTRVCADTRPVESMTAETPLLTARTRSSLSSTAR